MSWYYHEKPPSVAERRASAVRAFEKLAKKNKSLAPVIIEGTKIAKTFWGKAWCDNLESYKDFEYRLPRGRSYARHRGVLDLKITPGKIAAMVHGGSTYNITIDIKPCPTKRWDALKARCAGRIDSLIELLRGELSEHVIQQIIDHEHGLFPAPDEISMRCSCLDWADMCKHVAAAMYGVGHRLDTQPDLLFTLRGLDPAELIGHATRADTLAMNHPTPPTLAADQLADVFGIDLADEASASPTTSDKAPPPTQKNVAKKNTNKKANKKTNKKTSKKKTKKKAKKKATKQVTKKSPPRQSTASRQAPTRKATANQRKKVKKKK